MEDNLQNIIKRLKTICQEENLKVDDNTTLEIASKLYISENIDKSKKENIRDMKDYDKSKITQPQPYNGQFKGKIILCTDKQRKLMTTLKIPFTDKTTIKEAKELIELKLGKSKYKED